MSTASDARRSLGSAPQHADQAVASAPRILRSDASLAERIAWAQGQMETLGRAATAKVQTKSGGEYSYTYIEEGAIMELVRQVACAQAGIAVTPTVASLEVNGNGATVWVRILLQASGEQQAFDYPGFATDSGDKAIAKAITSATRQGLLKLWLQGGDPGQDQPGEQHRPAHTSSARQSSSAGTGGQGDDDHKAATKAQRDRAVKIATEAGIDEELLGRIILASSSGTRRSLDDLTRGDIRRLWGRLERFGQARDAGMAWLEEQEQRIAANAAGQGAAEGSAAPEEEPAATPPAAGSAIPDADLTRQARELASDGGLLDGPADEDGIPF